MEIYETLDSCYFCTTPYQVIGAMMLALNKKEISDLYIIGQFPAYKEIAKRLEKRSIFRKVVCVDESRFGIIKNIKIAPLKWFMIFSWYLQVESITKSIIVHKTNYRTMYFTSQTLVSRIVRLFFIKAHPGMQFFQFDEGTGSYFENETFRLKFLDKMARLLLFGNKALEKDIKKILYMPEVSQWVKEGIESDIIKMPQIKLKSDTIAMFNDVFGFSNADMISEDIVIFDTLREELYDQEGIDALTQYYNMIIKAFGAKRAILKSHPRSKISYQPDLKKYGNQSIPSEVILMNGDFDKKILVSTASSACITPKILFDKEPVVIFLYRLMSDYRTINTKEDEFLQRFRWTYRQPERFFIPNDKYEFQLIIEKLLEWY